MIEGFVIGVGSVLLIGTWIRLIKQWNNIDYDTHIDMVNFACNCYVMGSYNDFLTKFITHDLYQSNTFKGSWFSEDGGSSKIHANIIQFDNIGMMMKTKKDYDMVKKLMSKITKESDRNESNR